MDFGNFKEIGSVTLILFSVIDIVGSIPLILNIKKRTGSIEAGKATLVAAGIMLSFLYVGDKILKLFGVDIQSFSLAGALVIFILGLEMILGRKFFKDSDSGSNSGSIVPLAFPMIAGAGTITTVISLRSQYEIENIIVGVLINLALVYVVLRCSKWLEDRIGDDGLKVLGKVFGIVLLAISMKMFTAQLTTLKTNLQQSVEKIETTVDEIKAMHEENLRLMQRQDSILGMADTVIVRKILRRER